MRLQMSKLITDRMWWMSKLGICNFKDEDGGGQSNRDS